MQERKRETEHLLLNVKLGLEINEARPHDKLPYKGAWLWVGSEMIHLMELPNPDPLIGRPEHGGRDRHACISIRDVSKLQAILDKAGKILFALFQGHPCQAISHCLLIICLNGRVSCNSVGYKRNEDILLQHCSKLQVFPTHLADPGGQQYLHEIQMQMH